MQDTQNPVAAPVAVDPAMPVAPVVTDQVVPAPTAEVTPAPVAETTPGPEPVVMPVEEVKTDVKVELPDVPAATPVAAETPVTTPTV